MCSITKGWFFKCAISTDNCFLDTLASHLPSLQIRTWGCRQQQCGIMVQEAQAAPRQIPVFKNHSAAGEVKWESMYRPNESGMS